MSLRGRFRERNPNAGPLAKVLLVLVVLFIGNILCWTFFTLYW